MNEYVIVYWRADEGDIDLLQCFNCKADDEEHSREQLYDFQPTASILTVSRVTT